ncbi:MAG: cadherin-like domain-containing protein, partial [Planctomycetaceae bacterium]|nr:cadherin-like domain-containing protein [Planctomycetaceae bacterium]
IDGEVGVIEMGFCNFAVPDVGSTLENSILVHEHGHALVHRLGSGPLIGSGVQTGFAQPDAMHEGHADFLALWFEMDKNDTPEQPEISGEYYFNNPDGIRRQPYSYDMSVNPITFDSYNALPDANGVPNNESHNAGEIWASVLHDMTWELIFKYGGAEDASAMELAFNEDVYQSVGNLPGFTGPFAGQPGLPITTTLGVDPIDFTTGANNLALQLVIDGMKLTPYAATFDNARDGILAADIALTGGVNHDVIWKAFARRGLGYSAFSGIDQDAEVVAAAYDLPPSPADIAGTAFLDADGDGVRDLGEAPIAGVQLFMDLNGNGTHERLEPWTITDSDGDYNFVLYTGGAFTVKAIQQDDMQQTLPDPTQIPGGPVNHGGHDVYVVTGHSTANVDFGFAPNEGDLGINGMKFNDVNSNGVMDPGEVGVAGVFIYIDKDMDGRIDLGEPATRSAEDGSYYIEFNEGGTYHVREVVEPGWTQVSPAAGYHEVVIVPGLANYDIDFANGKSSDFGDLPITFDGSNPASHGLLDGLHLGTAVDADPGPNNGVQANGDDNTGLNDDDGVVFIDNLVRGMDDVTMEVTASIGDNSSALLNAWIDFDGDGIFDGANEQIVANLRLEEGVNSIDFAIPANAQVGASYARFRYGYEYNFGPNGDSLAGEVEDYRLDASFSGGIVDDNPIAVDDTFNVSPEDGPAQQLDVLANDFGSSNGAASLVLPAINPIVTVQGGSALVNLTLGMVLYTPPAEYAGPDSFDYEITDGAGEFSTATVAINVLPIFTEPEAVDDFIRVPENTLIGQPQIIDVLDNDIVGSNGPLTIASVTPSTEGHVVVNLAGNTLSYTLDSSDEWGLDSFEYSIVDSTGTPVKTATVTIECTPPENTVEYIVEAVDSLSGSTITTVEEGEQFTIRVSVKDSRGASVVAPADAGVYAGYVDLLYDADHLQVVPNTLNHGTIFTDITQGTADLPGLIDEVGGVQDGVDQSSFDRGTGAMELFTIDVTAIASTSGSLTALEADPINASPLHDTVVIAPSPASVDLLDILYSFTTIEITSPAEGESLLDTNGDGAVTPIDALGIINQLNTFGTGAVAEGETFGLDQAMDVNRDSFVSPLDALAIINYLNDNASEMGEGEAVGIVEQTTINTSVAGNQVSATEAVSADIIDEYLRVRENEIGLSYFTGGSQDVVEEDSSDLESAIDDLADDVFGQW